MKRLFFCFILFLGGFCFAADEACKALGRNDYYSYGCFKRGIEYFVDNSSYSSGSAACNAYVQAVSGTLIEFKPSTSSDECRKFAHGCSYTDRHGQPAYVNISPSYSCPSSYSVGQCLDDGYVCFRNNPVPSCPEGATFDPWQGLCLCSDGLEATPDGCVPPPSPCEEGSSQNINRVFAGWSNDDSNGDDDPVLTSIINTLSRRTYCVSGCVVRPVEEDGSIPELWASPIRIYSIVGDNPNSEGNYRHFVDFYGKLTGSTCSSDDFPDVPDNPPPPCPPGASWNSGSKSCTCSDGLEPGPCGCGTCDDDEGGDDSGEGGGGGTGEGGGSGGGGSGEGGGTGGGTGGGGTGEGGGSGGGGSGGGSGGGTGEGGGSSEGGGTGEGGEGNEEGDDYCDKYDCGDGNGDDVESPEIPTRENIVEFIVKDIFALNGACPADFTISALGHTFEPQIMTRACFLISNYVRPVVILFGTLFALLIVAGITKES